MKFEDVVKVIKEHWAIFVAVIVIMAPVLWGASAYYFRDRIELLKDQLQYQKVLYQDLEKKLKEPAPFVLMTPSSPAGSAPSTTSPPDVRRAVRYPPVSDPARLTKDEVRNFAKYFGLLDPRRVNPHLHFLEGDISYWYEQKLSEEKLKAAFEARRIVLDRAEQAGERIATQGDLSHKAQQIQATIQPR